MFIPALEYARTQGHRFVGELKEFVRFPSVSSEPSRATDVKSCAAWLAAHMRRVGFEHVQVVPTSRHPFVFGERTTTPGRPTVLIYGHYDVLSADPLGEWRTPPFQPVVRGQNLYGRGACDDKGQLFTHIKAIESYLKTAGVPPVNVKCLFEGEEEIDSPHLSAFVAKHRNALAADLALISDSRMLGPGRPAIGYSQRGSLRLELAVLGPRQDLHSGNFGGAVHNPLQALCEILAALHDPHGRVAIPGFYQTVRTWSHSDRLAMRRTGPTDERILHEAGEEKGWGEEGFNLYERTTLRPALTINGFSGGHQGPGVKAVIPSHALAKLSFRLVPYQEPERIDRLFRRQVARLTPPTVRTRVRTLSSSRPALVNPKHPYVNAAVMAYQKGFGASPVLLRSGGSIPAVSIFQEALGIPTVLMGFALPDDRIHAPNEKFHLPNFHKGSATSIWFLNTVAALRNVQRAADRGRDIDRVLQESSVVYGH
jgi:acetylornithine deacetylase/succinyl-diaminopimelate desuccinylase-like protein